MNQQVIQNIKISFPDLDSVKVKWAFESLKAIGHFTQIRNRIRSQLEVSNMMKLTRTRLKLHLEMVESHLVLLSEILSPLGWSSVQDEYYTKYILENSQKSMMLINYDYLFRDWIWGHQENRNALQKIVDILPDGFKPNRILVLGSGAGRLAYDLYETLQPKTISLVDMNPLLMMAAQKIISGEEIEMVELPFMPASLKYVGLKQKLVAPRSYAQGFNFILTDIRTYDFTRESYDLIITPWLIDVIDLDLNDSCSLIKNIGKKSSAWVNYGPLGFNSDQLRFCYSTEEAFHIFKKNKIEISNQTLEPIAYMHSPYSHSGRLENVLTFFARL